MLIDEVEGKPTASYYHAARANNEVANLGHALRFLESTGVGFIPGEHEENGKLVDNPKPPPPHRGAIAEVREPPYG